MFTTRSCAKLCSKLGKSLGLRKVHVLPDFTQNSYNVRRGNYSVLQDSHIDFFQEIVGEERVIMDETDLNRYNIDWYNQVRGKSKIVIKPKTTEEVSQILSFCNDQRLAVCPQGGNTCVSGGSVPVFDEIVLSSDLMNKIISLDETSGVLVCQAGCILENLNNFVADKKLLLPLDLGSKGSCHIGGNVSTNAGGLRLLRYGSLHGSVLGLEIVKADGEVLDCLSTLKKDNTGYHLHHLFIGSEGTLGFVTKVAIHCPPQSKAISLAFLGAPSYENVLKTFKRAKNELGEILSAVEVIDTPSMDTLNDHLQITPPIGKHEFYLLLETKGSDEEHDQQKLNKFLESVLSENLISDGAIASEPGKYHAMWAIRERLPEAFLHDGYVYNYDLTIPLEYYFKLVADVRQHVGTEATRVFGFGHLGDGNIHLQVSTKEFNKAMKKRIDTFLFNKVKELNGSISAEHGMGFLKAGYLSSIKNESSFKLMKSLKALMDPNGILNPYKVLEN
ncbi:hypothetical protein PPYR_08627 [Photinus pyralis]|uniref:D-2-hydroxyglutarate dehydrogenase, mitochondrial n=1 Tax=Photinus pyralis TaxID=7054 RepID=A0A1Y1M291_PHOPY|nr:D-2-hydroxyglutarate dehydrogenase, mitochondrial-like [Photinus pyralis]KAB0797634.1 hypothetical protein PPYR_08627 [Photinus pyralis]